MPVSPLRSCRVLLAVTSCFVSASAGAQDEWSVEVSTSSTLTVRGDNRNTRPSGVASLADDDFSVAHNRIDTQLARGEWRAGLQLDGAWYPSSPSPERIALELLQIENGGQLPANYSDADATYFLQQYQRAGDETSNRFRNWVYPAKYYARYSSRHFDVRAGDFYAQFGRGLVLSVRKRDALAGDTSLRGLKSTGRFRAGDWRFALTGLAGSGNPLRIDTASGRHLGTDSSVTPGWLTLTEAGMPQPVGNEFVPRPQASYAPDQLIGAQAEAGAKNLRLGLHGVRLVRFRCDGSDDCTDSFGGSIARAARSINNGSVSVDLPHVGERTSLYGEFAVQSMAHDNGVSLETGHAAYLSANIDLDPVNIDIEAKSYRRFYPLRANIDTGQAREFIGVQYSTPPTTEPVWNDTQFESFNTCVTGGRARIDVSLSRKVLSFLRLARYNTWAETVANESCITVDENLNRVWDIAVGSEVTSDKGRSRQVGRIGTRLDYTDRQMETADGYVSQLSYTEVYVRYDFVRWLGRGFSLQTQGWHRRRHQRLGGPAEPWMQGFTQTALTLAPYGTVAIGIEYDQNPQFPDRYYNASLRYNLDSASSLSLFVGQRQGGLRCIAGICRVFPPFEGVRLNASLRF